MQDWGDVWSLGITNVNIDNTNASANSNIAGTNSNASDLLCLLVPTNSSTIMPLDINAFISVRLSGFWRHSPQQWFTHAEAIFLNQRVRSDLSRVNHVLAALHGNGGCSIGDLLGSNVQYSAVKSRLVTAYDVPQATRFRSIIQHEGMGDRRHSQMLRNMRNALPSGIGYIIILPIL